MLTNIATWNINRQLSHAGPINVCLRGNIDRLHIVEPPVFISIPDSPEVTTLTDTVDKAVYAVYLYTHSHTYIHQTTILTRIIRQRFSHNSRLHIFLFEGENGGHTAFLVIYAFQRGHKIHANSTHATSMNQDTSHNEHHPQQLKQIILKLIDKLHTSYTQMKLILAGGFQHTIIDNHLHRMGMHVPPNITSVDIGYPHSTSRQNILRMGQQLRLRAGRDQSHSGSKGLY